MADPPEPEPEPVSGPEQNLSAADAARGPPSKAGSTTARGLVQERLLEPRRETGLHKAYEKQIVVLGKDGPACKPVAEAPPALSAMIVTVVAARGRRPTMDRTISAGRQGGRAIEDANVIESKETALEHVLAEAILPVHPPGEFEVSSKRRSMTGPRSRSITRS